MFRRKFIKGSAILGAAVAYPQLVSCNSGMFQTKTARKIYQILDAQKTMVGTLPILRAFAGDNLDFVSPFVLFDEFGPVACNAGDDPLRVDAHPHAGVTPTTYFLEGNGHHKDSLNYDFQIGKGDFMMFNSGRGAIHMEESGQKLYEEGGSYHGFQIWLNTPKKYKWDAPSATVDNEDDMAVIQKEKATIKVVLGELFGKKSSIETYSPAFYYHIKMDANARLDIPTDPMHNAFIYSIDGTLELEGKRALKANQIALFQRGDSMINLFAEKGAELLILGGQPLDEKVFSYGPFVMNTEEEIRKCIKNYQSGMMGNPDVVNR